MKLGLRMLRYRVAVMLLVFYLIGLNAHSGAARISLAAVTGALALAFSYVAATALNDIADQDIDRINHPGRSGRPLVTGEASERDLVGLAVVAALATLLFATLAGGPVLGAASVAVSVLYSVRPFQLSHRTYLAPLLLSFAYVCLPYALGVTGGGSRPDRQDILLVAPLLLLFLGRIVLKDFRDREGDRQFGKPTFLLRYGKPATCMVCCLAMLGSDLLFIAGGRFDLAELCVFQVYFAAMLMTLGRAATTHQEGLEQAFIGIGAKLGNGLLLTVLGLLVLEADHAAAAGRAIFASLLLAGFLYSFALLLREPSRAVIGYRG